MAVIVETREERVRYGQEDKYIDQFFNFGWRCTSKRILNRFGNPLPLGERVSENDLREKCFYQLTLKREVDESIIPELDALQAKYEDNPILDVSFGKGRIFWSVVLTIVFIALIVGFISSRRTGITTGGATVLIIVACISFGGAFALISTGIARVIRLNRRNDEAIEIQDNILTEARTLLRKQGEK